MILKKISLSFHLCLSGLIFLFCFSCREKQKETTIDDFEELEFAIGNGQYGQVKQMLLEYPELIKYKDTRMSLYAEAIRMAHFDIVTFLGDMLKFDVNGYTNSATEETVLHYASTFRSRKNKYIVMWLLETGADFRKKDKNGNLPINYAAERGVFNTFTLYERKGIPLTLVNKDNDTLLHSAVKSTTPDDENKKLVKYLIDNGLKVNARNIDGKTPLHQRWSPFFDQTPFKFSYVFAFLQLLS